jgi:transposase
MDKHASSKRYPAELKERAVRMVKELRQQDPGDEAEISRVAHQLGVGDESLRSWVKHSEIDSSARAGLATAEQHELKELRKEVRELPRGNLEIQVAKGPAWRRTAWTDSRSEWQVSSQAGAINGR